MKTTLFFIVCLFFLPLSGDAQTNSINSLYHKYKSGDDVRNITIPGFLVKLGSSIARNQVESPEGKEALKLAKKFKKLRLLVMEDHNLVTHRDFQNLLAGLQKERFEELITVRSEGTKVNLFVREKKKKDVIKNILILVQEEDSFVMVSVKTKLKLDDIANVINAALSRSGLKGDDNKEADKPKQPQA